jgi:predicted enzyme related to lactoylglutathione lyase
MTAVRICIDVDDLERAIAFYREVAGLRPARRFGPHWAEMLGDGVVVDLLGTRAGTKVSRALPSVKRDFSRHWTPVHLDFVVVDLDAAVKRATAAGATLEREVQERPYGRLANMADPFGHGFCLIEMNARGYDALFDAPETLEG